MTTVFTVLSLVCVAYRIRKGLFTRGEAVLLALWAAHFCLEELQLIAFMTQFYGKLTFYYSARFMRPAEFLVWGWLAWGVVEVLRRTAGTCRRGRAVRWTLAVAVALVVAYDAVLLVKARFPVGRRGAYVAAAEWAAEMIRRDWRGPAVDPSLRWDLGEYRTARRPVVDCHTARVAYLVGGRSNGIATDADTEALDRADYWIQDLRTDDPPADPGWTLLGTFRRGKYELPLYKRTSR